MFERRVTDLLAANPTEAAVRAEMEFQVRRKAPLLSKYRLLAWLRRHGTLTAAEEHERTLYSDTFFRAGGAGAGGHAGDCGGAHGAHGGSRGPLHAALRQPAADAGGARAGGHAGDRAGAPRGSRGARSQARQPYAC